MRISELARRAGVPVPTVKYYLREGLLPPGRPTAATQAEYDEEHVARLGLVRALLGPGGLTIARARDVLAAVDDPTTSVHAALGAAHRALPGTASDDTTDLTEVRALLTRWGWHAHGRSPALVQLAQALTALRAAGADPSPELLDRYARAAGDLGAQDVAEVPDGSLVEAVRFVVVHTVLLEPVLLALRRLAQEDASRRRFAEPADGAGAGAADTGPRPGA